MAPFLKFQTWGVPQKIDIHTTSTTYYPVIKVLGKVQPGFK